ncbi:MAG: RNA polymerase sigma factor [Acidimicrobiales bacterium]
MRRALSSVPHRADLPDRDRPLEDFGRFFDANFVRLARILLPLSPDAADAVQDAFVEAHQRWDQVGRYEKPESWVLHVATNRLRDSHRRLSRQRRATDEMRAGAVAPPPALTDDTGITHAIRQLPLRQRMAVSLYYLDDLSVREVAAVMRISEGTVRASLHAARRRLKKLPEEQSDDE